MEKKSKEEMRGKHWTEILIDRLTGEKKSPYSITAEMTTSGPAHLGTVCEFLYPYVLSAILKENGLDAEFSFIGNIMDAFDGIPVEMQKYSDILTPDLGKPLSAVKDPENCHKSFGDHYLSMAKDLMEWLSVDINVISADELYGEGKFDKYATLYLKREDLVKEVVARTSLKEISALKDWSPIMPICQKCGKVATTRVTWHNDTEYEYACDRDVKYTRGCTYVGRAKLSDHKYKLQWRLHWPSEQALFSSSIEGSGIDHMTRGGSADTSMAIHREILGREPPILFKYGFIFINGQKPSKSKGIGMSALELSRLIPPEMLKYALIEPDVQKDKNIDLTGDKLIVLYNDLERIAALKAPENRADEKKMLAFRVAVRSLPWKSSFVDMLLNYQITRDWDRVGKMLGDPEGTEYLSKYIEHWLAKGFAPDRYDFSIKNTRIESNKEAVRDFASRLRQGMTELEVHNLVYETAKGIGIDPNTLFSSIYTALIGKEKGPRMGKLIVSIGIDRTKEMLDFASG